MTYSLRDLPLPARLVIATFLISVGLGYVSALVQLHFQHAGKGKAFPTAADTIEIFSGVKDWGKPKDPVAEAKPPEPPKSKLEVLVSASDKSLPFNGTGTMMPAFFEKCSDYKRAQKKGGEEAARVHAERENERDAVVAWIRSEPEARKKAFEDDAFPLPDALKDKPFTEEHLHESTVLIRSILEARCVSCHSSAADQGKVELTEIVHFEPFLKLPVIKTSDGTVVVVERSPRQMSIEKLTQSTHAHLLSFSMLFGLTGLAFACTRYPLWLRMFLAPLVLLAQMIDVACWWLARLDGIGPYFALTIMVTGAIVGVGLLLQILLTLFDLFGSAGKIVLIMLATGAVFGAFVLKYAVVDPQLATERAEIEEVVHQNVFDEPAPPAEKGKTPPRAEEKPNVMPKVE